MGVHIHKYVAPLHVVPPVVLTVRAAGILVHGTGMELNETVCLLGIVNCIVFYASSKMLIYIFLGESIPDEFDERLAKRLHSGEGACRMGRAQGPTPLQGLPGVPSLAHHIRGRRNLLGRRYGLLSFVHSQPVSRLRHRTNRLLPLRRRCLCYRSDQGLLAHPPHL